MITTEVPPLKRRGPRKRLPDQDAFNTNLPAQHRQILDKYAELHGVSVAAALREAIELLQERWLL